MEVEPEVKLISVARPMKHVFSGRFQQNNFKVVVQVLMDAKDPHFSDYKSDMTYIMNSCGDLVLDQYIRLTGDSCPSVYLHVLPTQHTKGDRDSMLLFFAITNHACDVLLGERILRDVVSQFRTITKDTTPALWKNVLKDFLLNFTQEYLIKLRSDMRSRETSPETRPAKDKETHDEELAQILGEPFASFRELQGLVDEMDLPEEFLEKSIPPLNANFAGAILVEYGMGFVRCHCIGANGIEMFPAVTKEMRSTENWVPHLATLIARWPAKLPVYISGPVVELGIPLPAGLQEVARALLQIDLSPATAPVNIVTRERVGGPSSPASATRTAWLIPYFQSQSEQCGVLRALGVASAERKLLCFISARKTFWMYLQNETVVHFQSYVAVELLSVLRGGLTVVRDDALFQQGLDSARAPGGLLHQLSLPKNSHWAFTAGVLLGQEVSTALTFVMGQRPDRPVVLLGDECVDPALVELYGIALTQTGASFTIARGNEVTVLSSMLAVARAHQRKLDEERGIYLLSTRGRKSELNKTR